MAPQREWFEKDYYKVLGVSETATDSEISKAYRKLAKQYHPDAHPGSEDRFKEVSAAYDVLGNAERRKEYDEVRAAGPMGSVFGDGAGPGAGGFGGFSDGSSGGFRVDDLGDLLGNIFNRGGRSRGAPGAGPQRGSDLAAELTLPFMDAVKGLTTRVNVTSEAPCSFCGGSGAAPGSSPTQCTTCHGQGVVNDNQGMFSFSRPCPTCGGTGTMITDPCPHCHGKGTEIKARQISVRIPAGVSDGQKIRLKNRGGPGRNGGPSGDLYVTVHVSRHPVFGRKGKDITVQVPISFAEAVEGAKVTVPTLDGTVTVKVPPGSGSGRTLRVKGRGVHSRGSAGDLLVTLDVFVPKHPTPAEQEAIQALGEARSGDDLRAHLYADAGTGPAAGGAD